ncbi:MAG: cobalamin-dependent protein [Endomicrobiales bacterium]|nr:cobalamin-dependent protein [Endomicrobiales bacterium]
MKIAFVFAPFWYTEYPPLSIALLAAIVKKNGHQCRFFDLNKMIYDEVDAESRKMWGDPGNPLHNDPNFESFVRQKEGVIAKHADAIIRSGIKIIAFSLYCHTRIVSTEIARRIKMRDPSRIIIFGGPECSFKAESIMQEGNADFVVVGEGDDSLPELLGILGRKGDPAGCRGIYYKKAGRITFSGSRTKLPDLDKLPFPDFSGMLKHYGREKVVLPIHTSRGCLNRCAFCNEYRFFPGYRHMGAPRVFNEIMNARRKYNAKQFMMHESMMNGDVKMLEEFCDLMIAEKIRAIGRSRKSGAPLQRPGVTWHGQAVIRPEMTPAMLRKMKAAGCEFLIYGIESGSQALLGRISKNCDLKTAKKVIADTHEAGIKCQINFMFGLPTETERDFNDTLRYFREVRPYVDFVLASSSFCLISEGSSLDCCPERYGIEKTDPLHWRSLDGKNTYETRLRKYETFCALAKKLGIKSVNATYKENARVGTLLNA